MNKAASKRNSSAATHRTLQKSTTLNRHYVKRPGAFNLADPEDEKIDAKPDKSEAKTGVIKVNFARESADARRQALIEEMRTEQKAAVTKHRLKIAVTEIDNASDLEQAIANEATDVKTTTAAAVMAALEAETADAPAAPNPYQAAFERRRAKAPVVAHRSPAAKKEKAISDALLAMQKEEKPQTKAEKRAAKKADKALSKSLRRQARSKNTGKFVLAFVTSAACVAVLGYMVHLNMPDISVRVAAMQTGIEASYPTYLPRDFNLTSVSTDQENRVLIEFAGPDTTFRLTEENSSWDSNALLNNFVKETYGTEYTTIREQGITIYISEHSDATWVNGGIRYTLDTTSGSLTKKQIKNIAISL